MGCWTISSDVVFSVQYRAKRKSDIHLKMFGYNSTLKLPVHKNYICTINKFLPHSRSGFRRRMCMWICGPTGACNHTSSLGMLYDQTTSEDSSDTEYRPWTYINSVNLTQSSCCRLYIDILCQAAIIALARLISVHKIYWFIWLVFYACKNISFTGRRSSLVRVETGQCIPDHPQVVIRPSHMRPERTVHKSRQVSYSTNAYVCTGECETGKPCSDKYQSESYKRRKSQSKKEPYGVWNY